MDMGFEDGARSTGFAAEDIGVPARHGAHVSAVRLRAWLAEAQPGARLIYLTGHHASEAGEAVNALLHDEAARGMVYLTQPRVGRRGDGFHYTVTRSSRPIRDGRAKATPTLHGQAEALFARGGR